MLSAHKLRLLGRSFQRDRRAAAAMHDLRNLVEIAHAHKLLVPDRLVSLPLGREFARLQVGIGSHATLLIVLREREDAVIQRVEARQRDELEFVPHRAELSLERGELAVREMALPVERRRTVVREQLAGILPQDRFRELLRLGEIGLGGLEPQHVGVRRIRARAGDRRFDAVFDDEESLGRALAGAPAPIVFVDVARQQRGAVRVGARDQNRLDAAHVSGQARRDELRDEFAGGHEHLAAQMAALFDRRQRGLPNQPPGGSSKCPPAAPSAIICFMSSYAFSPPPKPASASATSGTYQSIVWSPFMWWISSARRSAFWMRRTRLGTLSDGEGLWSGHIAIASLAPRSE